MPVAGGLTAEPTWLRGIPRPGSRRWRSDRRRTQLPTRLGRSRAQARGRAARGFGQLSRAVAAPWVPCARRTRSDPGAAPHAPPAARLASRTRPTPEARARLRTCRHASSLRQKQAHAAPAARDRPTERQSDAGTRQPRPGPRAPARVRRTAQAPRRPARRAPLRPWPDATPDGRGRRYGRSPRPGPDGPPGGALWSLSDRQRSAPVGDGRSRAPRTRATRPSPRPRRRPRSRVAALPPAAAADRRPAQPRRRAADVARRRTVSRPDARNSPRSARQAPALRRGRTRPPAALASTPAGARPTPAGCPAFRQRSARGHVRPA